MHWIDNMWPRSSAFGASSQFVLRTVNRKDRRGINRRRLFRALAAFLAITASATTSAQTARDAPGFVVVLDAAHGGDDAGARLGGEAEKAYTLALSIRLRSLLAARGFSIVTTRESDATVDSDRRAEIANHADAAACLSLHAAESGSGVHLFVSSLAPVDGKGLLPWKTAQAAWIMRSLSFAGVVNSALSHASIPVTLGRLALPAIDSMTCPAVTFEIAPMRSNDAQAPAGLGDPDYQARVADALAAALVEWRSQAREDQQH
jgi:N-acetylmuramoyl-L-alanine amidase